MSSSASSSSSRHPETVVIEERAAASVAALVADLPLPGSGRTGERFDRLSAIAEHDLTDARLAEAHSDAVAILAELGGPPVVPGELYGVWAAAPTSLVASSSAAGWHVRGTKPWCSGAHLCTHALVTAGDLLLRVDLRDEHVVPGESTWTWSGLRDADTASVEFVSAPAVLVGGPGDYLDRPGFWHGAIGVAACWLGGARAVADALVVAHRKRPLHDHALAHAGTIEAELGAATAFLASAAQTIDTDPSADVEALALACRAVVERVAVDVVDRVGRAVGPAPMVDDAAHAERVAALLVYVRQSHAERDLAALGRLVLDGRA